MRTTRVNHESHCPGCGQRSDGATSMDGDNRPTPGDLSVCAYCATVLVYTDDLATRRATGEEIDSLPVDTRMKIETLRTFVRSKLQNAKPSP